jgi:hypothetical protein
MNAIFTGRKRSGKTTLAFDIAMRSDGGIIIFDPKNEWRGWPGTVTSVEEIPQKLKDGNEVIVFHPQGNKREAAAPLFKFVSELHKLAMEKQWDKADYHFTLIVDEAVNVSSAQWIDEDLLSLVSENRPEILNIFLTFQSPMDANNLLKSRVDNWFIFNTSLPGDLKYLHDKIGVPEQDLVFIQDLRDYEYAHFTFDGGTPTVFYEYDPDSWFRPLEFFELNSKEREGITHMARRGEKGWLQNLIEEFRDEILDLFEDEGYRIEEPRRRERNRESGGSRRRESEFRMSGFDRGRDRD